VKLELTSTQAAEVKPWLDECRETWTPCVLAGQLMPGDWRQGPNKIFLHYAIIRPETAIKIRRLIQKERETLAKQTSRG
jgi:hypothetical protein